MKLILFDFDGTLLDSHGPIRDAMYQVCDKYNVPRPATKEQLKSGVGLPPLESLKHILPGLPDEQYPPMLQDYWQYYEELTHELENKVPLFDGVLPLLDAIDAAGHLMGIVTSMSRRPLSHILNAHGITKRFVTLQTPDDGPAKPNPDPIWAALDATGADEKNAVMIGDSIYDIQAGKSARVKTIGVTWGNHSFERLMQAQPDLVAHSLTELQKLLLEG